MPFLQLVRIVNGSDGDLVNQIAGLGTPPQSLPWLNVGSPSEVRTVLAEKVGNLLEFADNADSTEYLQSIGYWPKHLQPGNLASPSNE
jgi:hypothetical protein